MSKLTGFIIISNNKKSSGTKGQRDTGTQGHKKNEREYF